jgi:hypothetical protein
MVSTLLSCHFSAPKPDFFFFFFSQNGLNALHLAAKEGHVGLVQELLGRGSSVDSATKVLFMFLNNEEERVFCCCCCLFIYFVLFCHFLNYCNVLLERFKAFSGYSEVS